MESALGPALSGVSLFAFNPPAIPAEEPGSPRRLRAAEVAAEPVREEERAWVEPAIGSYASASSS
jgi:hypothetical protein